MFKEDNLHEPFLNNSDAADQQHRDNNFGIGRERVHCQICSNLRFQTQMYTLSQNCDPNHLFCFQCLIQKLEESIKKNEDMFCPVDACPYILSEESRFFSKLPNNLHNKYVAWKSSAQYLGRNKSFRQSRRSVQYQNYFNYVPDNQQQYAEIIQPIQNSQKNNQKKDKVNNDNKNKGQRNKQNNNNNKKDIKLPKKKKKEPLDLQKMEQQIPIAPQNKNQPPIPFKQQPKPAVVIANLPQVAQIKQKSVEIPYNCKNRLVKFIYIVFCLPVLFILMGLLMVYMLFIYVFMIGMALGAAVSLIAISYCLIIAVTQDDIDKRNSYIAYTICLGFIEIVCAAFTRFFMKHLGGINKYFIKSIWVWWIQKIINIWAYPNQAIILNIDLRPNNQINQVRA